MNAMEKLAGLAARFDAEIAKPSEGQGSRADALVRGRIRYLQILGRRVCAESGLQEPLWVNDPLSADPLPRHFHPEELHYG